jgi:hypothetical protein
LELIKSLSLSYQRIPFALRLRRNLLHLRKRRGCEQLIEALHELGGLETKTGELSDIRGKTRSDQAHRHPHVNEATTLEQRKGNKPNKQPCNEAQNTENDEE